MEYFDNIGNKIGIGDEVLVLVPKTDATYRLGVIKDFRNEWNCGDYFHCEVLIEYWCERLYCDTKWCYQKRGEPITFSKKTTKAWRSNSDIIKFKSEYIYNK